MKDLDGKRTTRVFIIGRKTMCLEGLVAVLGTVPDIEIVGRLTDWEGCRERCREVDAHVVVVDMVHCPECGPCTPIEAVRELEGSNVVILGLPEAGPGILDAFEAGALGYVSLAGQSAEELKRVMKTVAAGEAAIDPRLSAQILARMRSLARSGAGKASELDPSDREQEVLNLLVAGMSNRDIAQSLHVSESTVKNHLHTLYSKMGVQSRAQAVAEAMRRGHAAPPAERSAG